MLILIMGGSGSGKSAYAEEYVTKLSEDDRKYYIATMQVYDAEGQRKVERHRQQRSGKGFQTIEQPLDIADAGKKIASLSADGNIALLECMSNLLANEMFSGESMQSREVVTDRIVQGIEALKRDLKHLIIVSGNVFEDGIDYEEGTQEYIRAMGRVNEQLSSMADQVREVVAGIPIVIKA